MRFKCPFVLFKKTLRSGKKVWYYYFYDEYNKRHQFSTGCTIKAQAEAVCMELYRTGAMIPTVKNPLALLSSRPLDQHGSTPLFREYTENFFIYDKCEYFKKKREHGFNLTKNYAHQKRCELERYILPFWGEHHFNSFTEKRVDEWISWLRDNFHLSNKTINNVISGLKVILSYAYKTGVTEVNYSEKVVKLKNDSKTHGILSKVDVEKMFDETNFNSVWNGNMLHYTLNLMASKTGLRLGEVQALRKENIFEDHLLINHGYVEKFGLQDTKNHKARIVPIQKELYEKLISLSLTQTEGEYIFSSTKGKVPIIRAEIIRYLKKALENIGISKEEQKARFITFHSWRHFANSNLINSGIPKSIVQSVIGHVNDDTMTEHYTHVSLDDAKMVLDVL